MTTKFYSYPVSIKIGKAIGWLMFSILLLCIFVNILLMIGMSMKWVTPLSSPEYNSPNAPSGWFVMASMLLGLLVFWGVIHSVPNIWIGEQGLRVQFMWWYIPILWNEIISVEDRGFVTVQSVCVKAHRITWLHYGYGLSHPAFMIYSSIEGYPELVHEIKSHCNTKSK